MRTLALPPVWRIPVAFLIALAAMTGTTALLQGRSAQFWQPLRNIQCERFQAYAEETEPVDVVFMGTSLTQHGFGAQLVEELGSEDPELGRPIRAFNLATQGSGIRMDPMVLRDLLIPYGAPKVLVIESSPERFNTHNVFNDDEFLRYYAQIPDLLRSLADGAAPQLPLNSMLRGPGVVAQWVGMGPNSRKMRGRIEGAAERRGGRYWDGDWPTLDEERTQMLDQTRDQFRERFPDRAEEADTLSDAELDEFRIKHHASKVRERRLADYEIGAVVRAEFEGLLELAREHDITVLLYDPPSSELLESLTMTPEVLAVWRAYMDEVEERFDVRVVSHAAIAEELEGLYRDGDHLAADGCGVFTRWFYDVALRDALR